MTSRSATVLVIFIIAIFAFCFASVFAAMTGPISILPQESDSGGLFDNLSAFTDDTNEGTSYGYQDYNSYSSYGSDHSSDSSNIETTTDDSGSSDSGSSDSGSSDSGSSDSSDDKDTSKDSSKDKSDKKDSKSKSSNIETTTG